MTLEEANRIFRAWQEYIEISDKLRQLFVTIPESFLPYPSDVLEEALNVVAKDYFDSGDKETSKKIQELLVYHLAAYTDDAEALEGMEKKLALTLINPELKDAVITNLKRTRDSWDNHKRNI